MSTRGRLDAAHLVGQPDQVVGGLAHGAHHHHHVVARRAGSGPRGRPRPGCGRRRRPRSRRTSGRPAPSAPNATGWRRRGPARAEAVPARGGRGRRVGCPAVPSEKRARQRAAREAKLAAQAKADDGARRRSATGVAVGRRVIAAVVGGHGLPRSARAPRPRQIRRRPPPAPSDHDDHQPRHAAQARPTPRPWRPAARRAPRTRVKPRPGRQAPAMTIDTAKTYTATVKTDRRDLRHHPGRQGRADGRQQLRLPGPAGLLQLRDLPPGHPGLRRPGRATPPAPAPAARATSSPRPARPTAKPAVPAGCGGHGQLNARRPPTHHQRQPVLHRHRRPRARTCRPTTCSSARSPRA